MNNPIRVPDDYRILAPLEDHLTSLCSAPKPVHGALYFVDYEGNMVAVAASIVHSYSEAGKIREAAGKVSRPWKIAEVHPFLTHGCFPCTALPLYFSITRDDVLYVGNNSPKADIVRSVSSISSSLMLEQMVGELKAELKRALHETGSPVARDSLATRRHYPSMPHSIVE